MQTLAQETLDRIKTNIDYGNWKDAVNIIADGNVEFVAISELLMVIDTSYISEIVPLLRTAVQFGVITINYKD